MKSRTTPHAGTKKTDVPSVNVSASFFHFYNEQDSLSDRNAWIHDQLPYASLYIQARTYEGAVKEGGGGGGGGVIYQCRLPNFLL